MKIMSNVALVLYIGFYLWAWKLFLDFESFSFLKLYAAVFILSAFTCLVLAKVKMQISFLSFFMDVDKPIYQADEHASSDDIAEGDGYEVLGQLLGQTEEYQRSSFEHL